MLEDGNETSNIRLISGLTFEHTKITHSWEWCWDPNQPVIHERIKRSDEVPDMRLGWRDEVNCIKHCTTMNVDHVMKTEIRGTWRFGLSLKCRRKIMQCFRTGSLGKSTPNRVGLKNFRRYTAEIYNGCICLTTLLHADIKV